MGYSHSFVNDSNMYVQRMACENCHMRYQDYYGQYEDWFSSQDHNAALYKDTVHFARLPYTMRGEWSNRWKDFERSVLSAVGHYRSTYGNDTEAMGWFSKKSDETEQDVKQDYEEFRKAFAAIYGWTPVSPLYVVTDWEEPYMEFDARAMHDAFVKGTSGLSSEQKERITQTLVAEFIYDAGIFEGMQAYNAVAALCEKAGSKVAYDWLLGYHTAFHGLCGGTCVCDGYAEIMQRCYDFMGVKCKTIVGTYDGEGHAWNMVTFSDGTERFVDATLNHLDYRILFPKGSKSGYNY